MSTIEMGVAHPNVEPVETKLHKVAHNVWRVITMQGFLPEQAPEYMSNHFKHEVEPAE